MRMARAWIVAALAGVMVAAAVAPSPPAGAESRHRGRADRGELSQDEIRDAVRRNEIRPYEEVAPVALKAMPGQIISVKVKRRGGRLLYELKIITGEGRVGEIYIDGATLEIMKVE